MIRRFNRFELKYILELGKAHQIMRDLAPFIEPDPHGGELGYRVCSLYYDSPDLDFFWAKIEGIKYRRKVRLRIYPPADLSQIEQAMVEIKQRINRSVQKRRLQLTLDQAYLLCQGKYEDPNLDFLDQQVASEIKYLVQAMHLRPTCIINYHRRAFIGHVYNHGLRITFDTDLTCRTRDLRIESEAENQHFLSPDLCVMEIKVNETVPDWVASLLNSHNCQLHRISKYCTGLAQQYQLPVMPLAHSFLERTG